MKCKIILMALVLLIVVALATLALAARSLLQENPQFEIVEQPAMHIIYMEGRGPYAQLSSRFKEVGENLRGKEITCNKLITQFFDNPWIIEKSVLRWHIGCVVDELPKDLSLPLKAATIPARDYMRYERDNARAGDSWDIMKFFVQATFYIEEQQKLRVGPFITLYSLPEPDTQVTDRKTITLVPVASPAF